MLPGKTWLLHSSAASAQRVSALTAAGAKLVLMPHNEDGWLDLAAVSVWLGQQQFNEVWAEPGARLAGALLQAGQVDEVWLYQAPVLLGADTRPLIATKMASLAQRLELTLLDVRSVGQDLRLQLRPQVRSL
jgi:diaminohydroxyphosphoribosylaminopyrimidine deaminase/5-amino-6-(5-phosphoribosylamino)uracil reductase